MTINAIFVSGRQWQRQHPHRADTYTNSPTRAGMSMCCFLCLNLFSPHPAAWCRTGLPRRGLGTDVPR